MGSGTISVAKPPFSGILSGLFEFRRLSPSDFWLARPVTKVLVGLASTLKLSLEHNRYKISAIRARVTHRDSVWQMQILCVCTDPDLCRLTQLGSKMFVIVSLWQTRMRS
jgi:hypothetical protein